MNTLISIGPAVFVLALVLAVVYMATGRVPKGSAGESRLGRHVLGLGAVGAVAFVAGAALGIGVFCAPVNAGNLCGLGGVLGSGPLLAGVAIAVHAQRQANRR